MTRDTSNRDYLEDENMRSFVIICIFKIFNCALIMLHNVSKTGRVRGSHGFTDLHFTNIDISSHGIHRPGTFIYLKINESPFR